MNRLYIALHISPLGGNRYILRDSFRYKDIEVPKHFTTNGADIPRIFWSFYPPNRSDYLPAVIVHDYLCSRGEYFRADLIFKEMLENLGIGKIDIFILHSGVRFYSVFIRPVVKIVEKRFGKR